MINDYFVLKDLPAVTLWQYWIAEANECWQRAAEKKQLSILGLLLGRSDQLQSLIEPVIMELLGEEQIADDPSTALSVWGPLSRRVPEWAHARLKAADLSLKLEQLEQCSDHLAGATDAQQNLPWLWDIHARLSLARQQLEDALRYWEKAIRLAGACKDEELAELFRQRRRNTEWSVAQNIGKPILSYTNSEKDIHRHAKKLESWAQRAGVVLSKDEAKLKSNLEDFSSFLDQASARLGLVD